MADPPAELRVVHRQCRDKRGRKPHEPDDDHEIEHPLGQQERPQRAECEQTVGSETDHQERDRSVAVRRRHRRDEARPDERREPQREHDREQHAFENEQWSHALQHARQGEHRHGEDQRARRKGRATGQRDHTVVPEPDAGRREPVQRQEARHDCECGPDEHGSRVGASGADHGQPERSRRRNERAEADRVEVHLPGQADLDVPPKHMDNGGCGRRRSSHDQDRQKLLSHPAAHESLFRHEPDRPLALGWLVRLRGGASPASIGLRGDHRVRRYPPRRGKSPSSPAQ